MPSGGIDIINPNDDPNDPNDSSGTGYSGPIVGFWATSINVTVGSPVVLNAQFDPTWTAVVYDTSIPNVTYAITNNGTVNFPTTYTGTIEYGLTCTKNGEVPPSWFAGTVVTVSAAPTPNPVITSFTAASYTITQGQSTTITPVFANGTGVIQPNSLAATTNVAISVTPNTTTTYILSVTGNNTTVTSELTITVNPYVPPVGLTASLVASPASIASGASSTLTPTFTGGTGSINQGIGSVTSGVGVSVTPAFSTYYTLTVTPVSGSPITAQAFVDVAPAPLPQPPSIISFSAFPSTISAGESTTLIPVFNGDSASINQSVGAVNKSQPRVVSPTTTTTYTLTVVSSGYDPAVQTATVTVSGAGSSNTRYVTTTWQYPSGPTPLGFDAVIAKRDASGDFNFDDSSTYLFPMQSRTANKSKNVVFTLVLPNQNQLPLKTAIRTVYAYGKSAWVDSPLSVLFQTNYPFVDAHPVNTSYLSGSSATLTVSAVGNGTLSYEWNKVGVGPISNTNSPSYVTNVDGTYFCKVTNTISGTPYYVISDSAIVAINNPPTITQQPANQVLTYVGDNKQVSIVATGSGLLGYQWYYNNTKANGYTQSSFYTGTNGSYYCIVKNVLYNTTSEVTSNTITVSGGSSTGGGGGSGNDDWTKGDGIDIIFLV